MLWPLEKMTVSLGEGPAQWLVCSAAGSLGSNHWCLPECRAAFYSGPRSRGNPTQTWWIFYLQHFYCGLRRESFEFSESSHKIPSILSYSSQSWHTYTPTDNSSVLHQHLSYKFRLRMTDQSQMSIFISFSVSRSGDNPAGNHSHSSIAWLRHKQDGWRAIH